MTHDPACPMTVPVLHCEFCAAIAKAREQERGTDLIAERAAHYGDPRPNHDRIAGLWSAWLGRTITAHDVACMMVLLKVARSKIDPHHDDNYDDAKAYLDIARIVR